MSEDFIPVQLPLMGEGVHEATVVKWFRKIGEQVKKDEPLIEVSTDKVDTEIPAPASGFLNHISIKEGQAAQVDQVMAFIGASPDLPVPKSLLQQSAAQKSDIPAPGAATKGTLTARNRTGKRLAPATGQTDFTPPSPGQIAGFVRSSPLVRKIARERGIDLSLVPGSGLYGRITRDDLEEYLKQGRSRYPVTVPGAAPEEPSRLQTTTRNGQEYLDGVPVRREKMSRIRQLTAEHMTRSVKVSPHVTTTFEIDLCRVNAVRDALGASFSKEYGGKLTYTAFFLYATARTLKNHPELNASIDGDSILYKDIINLGCAVAIDSGLIVPVVKDAGNLGLQETAARLNDLVNRARNKKLSPQDIQGGSFSLTNPGIYGSIHSQPIINQPQVGILSVGAIIDRPVVVNGEILVHPVCQAGLTFDHRLIDGEGGAKFLRDLKLLLENMSDRGC